MKDYVLIITIHADPAMPPGYDEWGGTHTYMRELLDEMDAARVNCVLITRRALQELPAVEQYRPHCVIYRLQNGPVAPIDKTLLRNYHDENLKSIRQIIATQESLPICIHSVYWNSGRLGAELSRTYHIPLVHSVISNSRGRVARGAVEPVKDRAYYEQDIYDIAKFILCVSQDERNDLIDLYHIEPDKIIVAGQYIHPSFPLPAHDLNGFPRLNSAISSEAQTTVALRHHQISLPNSDSLFWANKAFTYFGRIDKSKGVDVILSAWYEVYQRNKDICPPLWLIGGGIPEIDRMHSQMLSLIPELPDLERIGKIVWWGCLDPIGASTLLLKTLVLLTNSLYEPGGRVVVEAMSEGVPVIAAPHGFALDLIRNWENGFLVKHGDIAELALRMEHFIRQPFLSNALGANAKETAVNVMRNWDFTKRHLEAYGLLNQRTQSPDEPCINYFDRREIHLFPYQNIPLSNDLLATFFEEQVGETILSGPTLLQAECGSDIYRIKGDRGTYIIKHPITSLAVDSIINPVQNGRYVHNAAERYRFEKVAYYRKKSGVLIGNDDFHHLLLLRELPLHPPTAEELPSFINYLRERTLPLPEGQAERFLTLLRSNAMESACSIGTLLETLSAAFPDYCFDASGRFSPYVGWRIAPLILAHNSAAIRLDQIDLLYQTASLFLGKTQFPSTDAVSEINTDAKLRHICYENGYWETINLENRSIGMVEYEIADLLFDAFCHTEGCGLSSLSRLLDIIPTNCNCLQVLSSLSYRLFYDAILHIVMRKGLIDEFLLALEFLSGLAK